MKISIIIPVYNVEQYIEECLNSVIAQTYTGEMECLVVDDCGTDSSMSIVRKLINSYIGNIQFRLIQRERNGGLSAARNTGIQEAIGDYLYFLDSDDYITPYCIEALYTKIQKHPHVDIVQGNIFPSEHYSHVEFRKNTPIFIGDARNASKAMLDLVPMTSWNKLIRRSIFLEHNLLFAEGKVHEDEIWRLNAYKYISSVAFCFSPTYYYRWRPNSIMSEKLEINRKLKLEIIDTIITEGNLKELIETSYKIFFYYITIYPEVHIKKDEEYIRLRDNLLRKAIAVKRLPYRFKFLCKLLISQKNISATTFGRIRSFIYLPEYLKEKI